MGDETQQPGDELSDVVSALKQNLDDAPPQTPGRDLVYLGVCAALLGVLVVWFMQRTTTDSDAPQIEIATAPTKDSLQWASAALTAGLATHLRAGGDVRVRDAVSIAGLARSAGRTEPHWLSTAWAPATAQSSDAWQLRLTLNGPADGDSSSDARTIIVAATLRHPRNGRIEHEFTLDGRLDMLADLSARGATRLRSLLGLTLAPSAEQAAAAAEFPAEPATQRALVQGFSALARNDFRAAVTAFEGTLEAPLPPHPMLQHGLARAWQGLGYDSRAATHADQALATSAALPRPRQLLIQAHAHLLHNEWEAAQDKSRALFEFFPNDVEYGLLLADTQIRATRFDAARRTLSRLGELPDEAASAARIELQAARLWYRQGDWAQGIAAAERARREALDAGSRTAEAFALWWLNRLDGDPDGSLLARAGELFEATNNRDGIAAVVQLEANTTYARGELHRTEALLRELLSLCDETGNEARSNWARGQLGIVRDLQGNLAAGLALKQEVLAARQRADERTGIGISLENVGISLYKLGDLPAARQAFQEASAWFERSDDAIGRAWAPWHRGRIEVAAGNLDAAEAAFASALHNAVERPEGEYELHTRYEIAHVAFRRGRYAEAAELAAAVASDYASKDMRLDHGITDVLRARILQAQRRGELALPLVHAAQETFERENSANYLLQATTQRLRLGDLSACPEVLEALPLMQHRATALVATIEATRCPNAPTLNVAALRAEALRLGLFEPLLLLTARRDPAAAMAMAAARDWAFAP